MRMFPHEEEKVPVMPVAPDAGVDPVLVQAVDTVARRLVTLRAKKDSVVNDRLNLAILLADIDPADRDRVEARAEQLVKELDRGEGPFYAAYELLKQRAEHKADR